MTAADLQTFEQTRPRLLGLAYRILGTLADAEDVVQDCFLKWNDADRSQIATPAAWLTVVCTRRSLDLLQAAHRIRVDYVGPWLPEPIHPTRSHIADSKIAISLTTAFLLLLERLTPKERAVYLLHEVFDQSYADVATTLGIGEAACRQLMLRARRSIDFGKSRQVVHQDTQDVFLRAFEAAVATGNLTPLETLLTSDISLTTDTGGKVLAARRRLDGNEALNALRQAHIWWAGLTWNIVHMNGGRGAILSKDGETALAITFACDSVGLVSDIFVMLNPDKLKRLDGVDID